MSIETGLPSARLKLSTPMKAPLSEVNARTTARMNGIVAMTKTNEPAAQIVVRPATPPPFSAVQTSLVFPAQTLAANTNTERQLVFYAGPKEYRRLAKLGNSEEEIMNFGKFKWISILLLNSMNWLKGVFGNTDTMAILTTWIVDTQLGSGMECGSWIQPARCSDLRNFSSAFHDECEAGHDPGGI